MKAHLKPTTHHSPPLSLVNSIIMEENGEIKKDHNKPFVGLQKMQSASNFQTQSPCKIKIVNEKDKEIKDFEASSGEK